MNIASPSYYHSNTLIDKLLATQESLISIFYSAIQADIPLAIWQLPNDKTIHLILDLQDFTTTAKIDIEESPAGFVISPFINPNLEKSYFIKADLHWKFENIQEGNLETSLNGEKQLLLQAYKERIAHFPEKGKNLNSKLPDYQTNTDKTNLDFQALVNRAIHQIANKEFQKVVLSRTKTIEYPTDFELISTFEKLCNQYPKAFCYLFHLPKIGTWAGASPETLISVDKDLIFRTVALAGTQAYQKEKSLSEAVWTQKEIEEQAMVSRYIINCFKKIRLREFEEEGPKTVIAGNLLHLKTSFSVDMTEVNFPQLGSVMLELLHPTSAVCGLPKESALGFILQNEGYSREFYSGFVGPVNVEAESHIFVNLRCMQLFNQVIKIYAGAGITEDSHPEKEWRETEMKCDTLLNIIHSSFR
jgi:isochorismate synthase